MSGISRRIIRQEGDVIVVREAFGQVVEYDVYRVLEEDKQEYLGGGSKREALTLFRKVAKA